MYKINLKFLLKLKAIIRRLVKTPYPKEKTIDNQISIAKSNGLKRNFFKKLHNNRMPIDALRLSMIEKAKDPSLIESIKIVEHKSKVKT